MLDHVFLPVSDIARSVSFYEKVLAPLGLESRVDYDGKDGRLTFWLREGLVSGEPFHIGFLASSREEVKAAYCAAIDGHSVEIVYKSWQHPANKA